MVATSPTSALQLELAAGVRASELRVPPYPAIASALDELVRSDAPMTAIAALIGKDPALAAAVLRRASSAAHRSSSPPTLESALWRLGTAEVTNIALATGLGAAAAKDGPLAKLRRASWRDSLLSAHVARELAERRGLHRDEAFLAGLLHDFGTIVLLAALEARRDLPTLREGQWRELVRELRVECGVLVAARWQLPERLVDVLAHHPEPELAMRTHRSLVQLVHDVDVAIELLDRFPDEGTSVLDRVAGLDADEKLRIVALMPMVTHELEAFDPPKARGASRSVIAASSGPAAFWPVDLVVQTKAQGRHRVSAMSASSLVFLGTTAFTPGWLADVTLQGPDGSIELLVTITSCEAEAGRWRVTAQPFALAGEARAAWQRLVTSTRTSAMGAA